MKKAFSAFRIWRLGDHGPQQVTDRLVEEEPVNLIADGIKAEVLMATPGLERELAAGFCLTMGWLDSSSPACEVKWRADAREAIVHRAKPGKSTVAVKATGGGPLGPRQAVKAESGRLMEVETFTRLTEAMSQTQPLFEATGATHAVGLFDLKGELLVVAEDAGRHNALDKAVGSLWLENRLYAAKAAAFSGRMSLEMVLKSARAGLVFLAGVSAPTAAAVRAANDLGLTLGGFARKGKMNIYTHAENLLYQAKPFVKSD
ncbi:formate dehydrogenase accessory sulfurtransferase FdhD [Dethiosulfatarculus sandiegensis]|uniref:Protein FdhD n=1 Tax=Dethiosulfatarculus sandiegensis TaxID=1429043 RepID=A0A0D2GN45_9BACT|nr:formate dehydrogenase accessory sulfurtransferase FdhD [Dethiosulfatarculus sandiegensis]KIX16042.1 hypothetical protein X474_00510 [Dethiosulfatarculus sandiegensis]